MTNFPINFKNTGRLLGGKGMNLDNSSKTQFNLWKYVEIEKFTKFLLKTII
jgi:hypothetical protein